MIVDRLNSRKRHDEHLLFAPRLCSSVSAGHSSHSSTSDGVIITDPGRSPAGTPPIKLGLASYTFRNFTRAQLLDFMKQLKLSDLNAKDVKDHLPTDPTLEAAAVSDYASHGIQLHAIGARTDDDSIRANFEYAKRAGVKVIVAGDPTPESLPRIERFVKEYDIRLAIHSYGPEDISGTHPLTSSRSLRTWTRGLAAVLTSATASVQARMSWRQFTRSAHGSLIFMPKT